MKKRVLSFLLAASMVASLAACGGSSTETSSTDTSATTETTTEEASAEDTTAAEPAGEEGKIINVYSWNEEFKTRLEFVYDQFDHTSDDGTITYLKDGTEIHWTINPNQDGVYQTKLDEALLKQADAATDDKIDIFMSETDYVTKYTDAEADVALPLTDIGIDPNTDLADQYPFTKVVASDANNVQRGTTWQACPCLFVYRRDIAKDALGTDDPDKIHEMIKDWATMKETAGKLKDKGYYVMSSYADTFRAYGNSISAPWVQGGSTEINVDPQIMNWINDSKEWLDAGYFDPSVKGQWNDDWYKSMGSKSKSFGFLLPAWGIDFVVKPNWDGKDGAWAATDGPQAFNWGGSFIHACRGTDNPQHIKDIMLAFTANKENLMKVTKEFVEFGNTMSGMKEIAEDDSFGAEFLGGENPYKYFTPAADSITMATLSSYDQGCVELIQSSFTDYFDGNVDFDTAKANFEKAIMERYPEITAVNWP